jgi:hypothetical protein
MKISSHIKILYRIIYIFFLLSYINSNEEYLINLDGEDCSYAPSNPENEEQCTSYNTEDMACCYVEIEKIDRTIVKKCVEVEKDARFALNHLTIFSLKTSDNIEYNDVIGKFKCGQEDKFCGMNVPNEIFQCSEHSSTTRSCCYLSTPTYTECILSDKKYDKETTFKLFEDSNVYCLEKFYRIQLITFICFFCFLFL